MTTTVLKKEMHQAIDVIEDAGFLKAVHTILNEKKDEYDHDLSPDQWEEIDRRIKLHKAGKSKNYTWEEVRAYAKSKLKK